MAKTPHPARVWAKSFPQSKVIVWGDVERHVLALTVPDRLGTQRPPTLNAPPRYLSLGLLLVPIATVVLVFIGIATRNADLVNFAQVFVFGSLTALLAPVVASTPTHRRSHGDLLAVGSSLFCIVVVTVAVWLALQTLAWVVVLSVLVTLVGVLSFVVLWRFRSAPLQVRRETKQWTDRELWFVNARAIVLEVFLQRNLVSQRDIDQRAMNEMPLGAWREIDALATRAKVHG